ncbi:MAG: NAD(P)/FAD-dependent oxidoreductase [Candidatus Competibacteraceae bacterium]|nr:NAD(P)/FAD-dependent oxidoreductase [Candidatus Competibacteraceae bacterium]
MGNRQLQVHEVIIIGGGPAGSSCAWQLRRHGVDCLVLDRQTFPRPKLCAGWITPEVVRDLALDVAAYPQGLVTFNRLHVKLWRLGFKLNTVQHSIRRYEFDAWLLARSGAPVQTHYARHVRYDNGGYLVDDRYRCRYLVGAGGTQCPVYRALFRDHNPRAKTLQAVTLEEEFPYDWQDPDCRLWFFDRGLPGYSWYVPKANGYINVGVGGMAHKLKQRRDDIKNHWRHFTRLLARQGLVTNHTYTPGGYSYYLRENVDVGQVGNAFVVGDAAGLATRDLCEGIGPAVKSGLLVADVIAGKTPVYSLNEVAKTSGSGLMSQLLEYMFITRRERERRLNKIPASATGE